MFLRHFSPRAMKLSWLENPLPSSSATYSSTPPSDSSSSGFLQSNAPDPQPTPNVEPASISSALPVRKRRGRPKSTPVEAVAGVDGGSLTPPPPPLEEAGTKTSSSDPPAKKTRTRASRKLSSDAVGTVKTTRRRKTDAEGANGARVEVVAETTERALRKPGTSKKVASAEDRLDGDLGGEKEEPTTTKIKGTRLTTPRAPPKPKSKAAPKPKQLTKEQNKRAEKTWAKKLQTLRECEDALKELIAHGLWMDLKDHRAYMDQMLHNRRNIEAEKKKGRLMGWSDDEDDDDYYGISDEEDGEDEVEDEDEDEKDNVEEDEDEDDEDEDDDDDDEDDDDEDDDDEDDDDKYGDEDEYNGRYHPTSTPWIYTRG
ncbi:hypothetical protein ONZ45_g13916 [Pleurotus djamor]|nr:hypothetical protein ONZ45_g13916 [Pleurotus djamor]